MAAWRESRMVPPGDQVASQMIVSLSAASADWSEHECWLWTGTIGSEGYGRLGRNSTMHRLAYQRLVGEIPEGLHIDHLCRTRNCVNPAHLEPVTNAENRRRGLLGELRTTCKNGHPWVPENLYCDPSGWRHCRVCGRDRARVIREARRQALA